MKNKGFSLIEVMVAMMIFAGCIMVINNIWSGNLLRIRKARRLNQAAFFLKSKITEYEIKYAGKPLNEIAEKEAGDFGSEHPNFSWAMESREFEMPDLSSAMGGDSGSANPMMAILVKTMTDFINKSVKEVKISVFITGLSKKKKALVYSLTTLFVDYDQEISLPGLGGSGVSGDQ